jgi:hypothetical protein
MVAAIHRVLARWEQIQVVAVRETKELATAATALLGASKSTGHKV